MANIEKPTPSLEVVMQKYFKVFAILLIVFVVWRMFSPQTVESTFDRSAANDEQLKAVVSAAVEEALSKRDIPVLSNPHEVAIQTTSDSYTIRIPKAALQAASNNIVVRNANSIFTIGYSQASNAEDAAVQPVITPNEAVNTTPVEVQNGEVNSENSSESEKSPENSSSNEPSTGESSVTPE